MPVIKKASSPLGKILSGVIRLSGKRTLRWTIRPRRRASALLIALLASCIPAFMPMARALDLNALPSNGTVRVGAGSITQSGNQLTVQQSTAKLGLDWQSFNIGANASVNFVQPGAGSIALNRVVGNDASQIFGRLTSNGQVFLTNPNGVLFAPGSKVDVGGLVASTLDLSQDNFASGNYRFSGTGGSVINQGSLRSAPGGYVALFGGKVDNQAQIDAKAGSVVLASGSAVTVRIDQSGLFSAAVTPATAAALVSNSGSIQADGGSVRLDAQTAQGIAESLINNSGVIRAASIENKGGEIWLTGATQITNSGTLDASAQGQGNGGTIVVKADMQSGTAQVGGSLLAQGGIPGGDGGQIETSGAHTRFASDLVVNTAAAQGKTGQWLIDPNDFVIAASGGDISGATLASNLLSANVTIESTAGTVVTSAGNGDILVNDGVAWSGSNTLTLNALRNINVNATISNAGGAKLLLHSDDTGSGTGTVIFGAGGSVAMGAAGRADLYYNPSSYAAPTNFASSLSGSTNWTAWMLVNTVGVAGGTGKGLQAMNSNLSGNYALGTDIDASGTAAWNANAGFAPIGSGSSAFTGKFDGLNHNISGLTINRPGSNYIGLFGYVNAGSASIENVNLSGGAVTGSSYVGAVAGWLNSGTVAYANSSANVAGVSYLGGLAGQSNGAISWSSASGLVAGVTGAQYVGGLVGYNNSGSINHSYASGAISVATGGYMVGGLVGYNYNYYGGSVTNSYAAGITNAGAGSTYVGGLIGYSGSGVVSNSFASNAVTGTSNVGPLFGVSSGINTNVYYNIDQSTVNGQTVYGANALDSVQIQDRYQHNGAALDIANYASSFGDGTSGAYEISTLQGLKDLLGFAGNAQYSFVLTSDLDLASLPGYSLTSFTAKSFDGKGHTLSNLSIAQPGNSNVGFIGTLGSASTLSNLVLSNVHVNGASNVGAAVGNAQSPGSALTMISNVSVSGSVTGTGSYVGGLVGQLNQQGGISSSSSTATVQGLSYVGGLVGYSSIGSVTGSHADGVVTGTNYVGGLVGGSDYTNVSNSYAQGAVNAGANAYAVGGLIGSGSYYYYYASYYGYGGSLSNVYSTATVNAGANSSSIGGLVGNGSSIPITNAYATGAVTGGSGSSYVGGLVGYMSGTINNAYASGAVVGTSNVGPLFGTGASANYTKVMYDIDHSTVNGVPVYGPYGLGQGQFQEVLSTGTLNIANYSSLAYDSVSNSYVISSLQGLKDLLGFSGASQFNFSLAADLDLAGVAGYYIPTFSAQSFNGNNHTLSHLSLNTTLNPAATTNLGLFGTLGSSSTVSNLNLVDVSVSGISNVGGLVGQMLASSSAATRISHVNVSGVVSATSNYAGGVVGLNSGSGGLDNVVSTANVSGTNYVGGVLGYNASYGAISNSSASGTVAGSYQVGGLVGTNYYGIISGSSASGAVTGGNNTNYLGGLVGQNYGAISNSYATGNVSAGNSANYLGGLAGYNNTSISNSYATGSVSGGTSSYYLGGLIGINYGVLNTVYATGATNGSSNGNYVGGLAGYSSNSVSNSYASGAVVGATNTAVLFGQNTSNSISNVHYDIDSSTVNGSSVVGPYGIYHAQFQDWANHNLTLDIANYASTLPYDSTSGTYGISSLDGMKDLLGFAGVAQYSFKLTATSLDMTSLPGYYIPVFTAHSFDGNGNTLSNVSVNQPGVNNIGFIGSLGADSRLSNLTLANLSVAGGSYVGGAVGVAQSPASAANMISNVSVAGAVSGSANYVGGVVGQLNGSGGIAGSSSSATVQGNSYVGGLVGSNSSGAVSNSFATGAVSAGATGTVGDYSSWNYIGGLIGNNGSGAISNVYATGAVNAANATGYYLYSSYVGGLLGYNSGTVNTAYASGAVTVGNGTGSVSYIGGLIGINYGTLSSAYATGSVTVGPSSYVGGLVGRNYAAISNSHATGSVSGGASSNYFGGLIGYNNGVLGTVYATGVTSVSSGGNYVGGLAGYNTSSVSNSYASGAVVGATNTAVLFGQNTSSAISNVHYDIDSSTVNGNPVVGPYGIYDTQFQDWASHNLTLDIANYNATLPYDSTSSTYGIADLQGMKDLLGFVGVSQYNFKLTAANLDLASLPGYYIPVFTAHSFDGNGNTISNLNVNQTSASSIGFIGTLGSGSTLSNLTLTNVSVIGGSNVGGAVGIANNPSAATAKLSNISVSGAVTGNGDYVGGVVGQLGSLGGLTNVSSSVTVRGATNYVGGVAGSSSNGVLVNVHATGSVTGTGSGQSYIGGLLGYGYYGSIDNSSATGTVNAGSNGYYAGGLVGQSDYTTISNSYALGNVTGYYMVGGLVGHLQASITNSFATGSVSGYQYVGGLLGYGYNYYSNTSLSNVYATGAATGSYAVGGLAGELDYSALNNAYSSGLVSSGGSYHGGLIGYSYGITGGNNYWNTTTSGFTTSAVGTGLTTAQMQSQASFNTWNFANTWKIYEGNTYPMLQSFLKPLTISADSAVKDYDQQAYSGAVGTVSYSDTSAIGHLQGSLLVSNSATGAINAGTYFVTPSGVWSNSQFGYNISFVAGNLTVNPLTVTVSGLLAADKVYDGNLVATVNGGSLVSTNVLPGDSVSVVGMLGTFADKNVGAGKTVSIPTGTHLGGAAGINYVVTNDSTATASITPKSLDVNSVTVSNKVYDGNRTATLGGGALLGVVTGDSVTLSGLTGSFADKNVGTAKTVTITGGALVGADAGNYQMTSSVNLSATADISALAITSSGIAAKNKVYDQLTTVTGFDLTNAALNGVITGDVVALDLGAVAGNFVNKNAGVAKAVTITGMTLSGTDAQNYSLSDASNATASITPKEVVISGATAVNRAYNGSRVATINGALASGVISGDSINTASLTGLFDTKDVGTGKSVSLALGSLLGGTDGANYMVGSANTMSANITPLTLHATSIVVSNKAYDGTTAATIGGGLLSGVVGTDNVRLTNVSANFADKGVGQGKTVTVSGGALTGTDAGNYQLSGSLALTTTANITARAVTVSGITAQDKVYDRTTTASLDASAWAVSGLLAGDDISVNISAATGAFANKNVGLGKAVTVSGLSLAGVDAANYSVLNPLGLTATITAAPVSITGNIASLKTYDGNANAIVTGGVASGVIGSDVVVANTLTGLFDSKNVGYGKTVTLIGRSLGGTDGANYKIVSADTMSADITPKQLSASALTALNKAYDGNVIANLTGGILTGVVPGDNVSLTSLSGTFADKNVGTAKTVTISGGALTGADASNYDLPGILSGTTTANITKRTVSTTGITAQSKTYDQSQMATIDTSAAVLGGAIAGDQVIVDLSGASGSFANKNVGTSKLVTISGLLLNGNDASNYTIIDTSNALAAIVAKAVTLSGNSAANKVYNGDTLAVVSAGTLGGVIAGDNVNTTALTGQFDTRNAGVGKTVTVVGKSLLGADGGNYVVSSADAMAADITPKILTASAVTVANKVYDAGVTAKFSGGLLSGVVLGDNVSLTAVAASFIDKNVGTGKTVNISGGNLTGLDSGNYQLSAPVSGTTSATISALAITTSGITAQDKVYNQSSSATISTAAAALNGVLSGDSVALDLTGASGAFADKNVGTGKSVTVSGLLLSGTDAGNYSITDASHAIASITPVGVILSGYSAGTREYDGTRTALVSGGVASGTLVGDTVNTTTLSGLFDTKNVGTGKTVTIVGSKLAGIDGGNYVVTDANALTADITPRQLTISAVTVANRIYDSTVSASLSGGLLIGVVPGKGVVSGDSVGLTALGATFSDKNAGVGKTVTLSGGALTGSDIGNYQLTGSLPSTAIANITPLAITSSGITAQDRAYDRSTAASISTTNAALQGVLTGDSVSLNLSNAAGSFADKNVSYSGSTILAKAVSISGLTLLGTDATNYSLSDASHATAKITPVDVSITGAVASNKVYDGKLTANITGAQASGVLTGDVVTLAALTGQFDNKNVGTAKAVSLSGMHLGGTDGGNYVISTANTVSADITPRQVSASAVTAADKVYDGTVAATLNGGVLSGLVTGDLVSLASLSGTFADKSAGLHKTVTISAGGLTGADAGNYQLTNTVSGSTTATITQRTLGISGVTAQDKVYDQLTQATINATAIAINNVVTGDNVVLDASQVLGSFANKNVGTAKSVSLSGLVLNGADASNYLLSSAPVATASITPLSVSLTGYSALDKTYDGTTAATIMGGVATGILAGDHVSTSVLTGLFDNKNVGNGKAIIVNGGALAGADGGNYSISGASPITATVYAKSLSVSAILAKDKVYDGNAVASFNGGVLSGVVTGDTVALSNLSGVFSDKNAGVGKTVAVSGGKLTGTDASNYFLSGSVSGTTTATITPLALTISGITAQDKVYDRSTSALIDIAGAVLHGVLIGDSLSLSLTGAQGNFVDKNAGVNKSVSVSGLILSGADAQNYSVANAATPTATITPKSVTISGATAALDKEYDGTRVASITGTSVTGVILGDSVSLSAIGGLFDTKDVGTNKLVTLSGAALSGVDGANYSITNSNTLAASITRKMLTVENLTALDKVYDGTTAATITGGLVGKIAGDNVALTNISADFMLQGVKDANVGKDKDVLTQGGGTLGGSDAFNYDLTAPAGTTLTASITKRQLIISANTVVVQADQLATVTTGISSNVQGLAPGDALAAMNGPVLSSTLVAGSVDPLTPSAAVFKTGLDSNYDITYSSGYVVVLPSQTTALSGGASNTEVLFINIPEEDRNNALQASARQMATELRTIGEAGSNIPPLRSVQDPRATKPEEPKNKVVASSIVPTQLPLDSPQASELNTPNNQIEASNSSSPNFSVVQTKDAGLTRQVSLDQAQTQATNYQKEIQKSTPDVIENLRAQPLLQWNEKLPELLFNLSDSGVRT